MSLAIFSSTSSQEGDFRAKFLEMKALISIFLRETAWIFSSIELAGTSGADFLICHPGPASRPLKCLAPSAPAGPFEAQASDRLAPTLAALLGVAPEAVPVALEDVGDELLFHLITRPHDYDRLKAALVTPAPASPFESDQGADPRVAQVRADLRSPARSARLRALLTAD